MDKLDTFKSGLIESDSSENESDEDYEKTEQ
jgi:hypothetical protein